MPIEILMPALSPTMTEGKLAKWLKQEGEAVKAGDVLAEIETDKATMEVEAVDEGTLGRILIAGGTEGVAVNTPIALLLEEGESATALNGGGSKAAAPTGPREGATGPADAALAPKPGQQATGPVGGMSPSATLAASQEPAVPAAHAPADHDSNRLFASPLAKRMAAQAGLDLTGLRGTGPHGRIVKADVEAALARGPQPAATKPAAAPAPATAPTPAAASAAAAPAAPKPAAAPAQAPRGMDAKDFADKLAIGYKLAPNSGMRKTIARRLSEAWQTIPHFALTVDLEIDRLLALRAELNARSEEKVSVNDFVVKAVALALRKVPAANASWHEDGILLYADVDVSVAVATEGGLITPIVRQADRKGLAAISAEVKALAAKARDGKLKPEEYQGGGFSVSNLGMFGIKSFTSIINPPQSCILSVGVGEKRPVVKDDALAIATVMTCTLSVDHRSVDGAVGAQFLKVFKGLVEDPITMML